jgi:hypothetical protein
MVYLSTLKASFSYSFHAGSHILDCSTFIALVSKFELYNVGCLSAPLVWGLSYKQSRCSTASRLLQSSAVCGTAVCHVATLH